MGNSDKSVAADFNEEGVSMASISCPLCGAAASARTYVCGICGYSLNTRADNATQKPTRRWALELDGATINRMGDALLDFVAIYGWETAEEIWWDTDGLVTGVENTLAMYPKRIDASDEDLKDIVRILRSYPDHYVITAEFEDYASKDNGYDRDGESNLDSEVAHKLQGVLERHDKEQQQINLKNAHDYEHIEAMLKTGGLGF